MCITSETCRADSVIKTAQNNLHQAGPNKTHIYDDAWKYKNQMHADLHVMDPLSSSEFNET